MLVRTLLKTSLDSAILLIIQIIQWTAFSKPTEAVKVFLHMLDIDLSAF